jgi:ATPase subunit of ABC transporter with duplicated ATPase domains
LNWLSEQDPQVPEQKLREILARVLFSGDDVKKPVNVLSGGEMARLILGKMMLLKHNILIFDEPTNHLDMESIQSLLDALSLYSGTIIFVSHNRHFVSHLATRVIELSTDGVKDFQCTYPEYIEKCEQDLLSKEKKVQKEKVIQSSDNKNKYQDQKKDRNQKNQLEREVTQLEKKCAQIEEKVKKIDTLMLESDFFTKTPNDRIQELTLEKEKLENDLDKLMKEWEEKSSELLKIN